MREVSIENFLRDEVARCGGFCVKLNPLWNIGIPDRLVVLPGCVAFVELKRPKGGRLSVAQKFWSKRLTEMGCEWHMLHTKIFVNDFLTRWRT